MLLEVDAVSGSYAIPGPSASGSGGLVPSYPIAPPSTIRGFLESLCGKQYGEFKDLVFTYGYRSEPEGRGLILRKDSVWSSSGLKGSGELKRPLHHETFFGMHYWIRVEGLDGLLREALQGEAPRFGPLFLGESADLVTNVREIPEIPLGATKLVPGRAYVMPWISGRGFGQRNAVLKSWDLVPV